jgi:hypothetical protein
MERRKEKKQPFYVKNKDDSPIFLAGIYDTWNSHDEEFIYSFTMITIESPENYTKALHHRIPIILDTQESRDIWLNVDQFSQQEALKLIKPIDTSILEFYPVSDYVNKTGNEGPKCIKKVSGIKKGPMDKFFKPKVSSVEKKEEIVMKEQYLKDEEELNSQDEEFLKEIEKNMMESRFHFVKETPEEIPNIPSVNKIKKESTLILDDQSDQLDSQDERFIESIEKERMMIDLVQQEEEEREWNLKRKQTKTKNGLNSKKSKKSNKTISHQNDLNVIFIQGR